MNEAAVESKGHAVGAAGSVFWDVYVFGCIFDGGGVRCVFVVECFGVGI